MIRRALLSCSDKTGLEALARALQEQGAELIATGGTAKALEAAGLKSRTVEDFAGIAASLDGRVKTLHPALYQGILARRDSKEHVAAVGEGGLIDMVVVNLYPFEATIGRAGVTQAEAVEQIDIGGVALLRAAAKNFAHVAVVSDPAQYPKVIAGLKDGLGEALRRELAVEAFARTTAYDQAIGAYLSGGGSFPDRRPLLARPIQELRYGENPHQKGAWYRSGESAWGLGTVVQHQGKELSFNNLLDMDAAFRCLLEFGRPACVVIKHASQCGLALAESADEAYRRAWACDPESAFGGIVGINREVDEALARALTETFLEVVIAPRFKPAALAVLAAKKNLRAVSLDWPAGMRAGSEWRALSGAWIVQERDARSEDRSAMKVVTRAQPSAEDWEDLLFAWASVKHVKSNGIVLAKARATVGIGQGQPSRVGAARIAVEKAGERARGCVAASDAFFPFADGITPLAAAGVRAVIQPGGSIRDEEVIAEADRLNVAMVFTGVRHFRH